MVNGALFVLVGLQLPSAVKNLQSRSLAEAVGVAALVALVALTVIGTRLGWMYTVPYVVRLIDPALAWAGFRGAISLAAASRCP